MQLNGPVHLVSAHAHIHPLFNHAAHSTTRNPTHVPLRAFKHYPAGPVAWAHCSVQDSPPSPPLMGACEQVLYELQQHPAVNVLYNLTVRGPSLLLIGPGHCISLMLCSQHCASVPTIGQASGVWPFRALFALAGRGLAQLSSIRAPVCSSLSLSAPASAAVWPFSKSKPLRGRRRLAGGAELQPASETVPRRSDADAARRASRHDGCLRPRVPPSRPSEPSPLSLVHPRRTHTPQRPALPLRWIGGAWDGVSCPHARSPTPVVHSLTRVALQHMWRGGPSPRDARVSERGISRAAESAEARTLWVGFHQLILRSPRSLSWGWGLSRRRGICCMLRSQDQEVLSQINTLFHTFQSCWAREGLPTKDAAPAPAPTPVQPPQAPPRPHQVLPCTLHPNPRV
jgi:hypothetical protein